MREVSGDDSMILYVHSLRSLDRSYFVRAQRVYDSLRSLIHSLRFLRALHLIRFISISMYNLALSALNYDGSAMISDCKTPDIVPTQKAGANPRS